LSVELETDDLHEAGVRRGERVAVWVPSRVEAVVTLLACSRNGYVCIPSLHQNYTVAEVLQLLGAAHCSALIAQSGYGADATGNDAFAAAAALRCLRRVYGVEPRGGAAAATGAARAFPSPRPDRRGLSSPLRNPDKVTYLAFTSGTTGAPKGVMHSDNTLLANARAMVRDWGHDSHTVLLSLSPVSHHIATVGLAQSLVAGCEFVLNDPPSGRSTLEWIVDCGATYAMGVPTHAIDVMAAARRAGDASIGKIKVFYLAGATIPRELAENLRAAGIAPQNVYGMTENGSHQYTLPTDDPETIVSSCGRACAGYEIRLWRQDEPDIEAAAGEVGEIGSRGALLMLGYFANQAATESSFNSRGWFMSGDLGRLDERGNLKIVGRKKDLIIRGGHNIHPARIEDLAHRHPAVFKAAAFAVPDDRLGEKVCLAIIAREGQAPAAEEMLAHLNRAGLSGYDMPEFYLAMDAFPLTASGKILKRELAQWAREGRIKPQACRWVHARKENG